ncbi:MAG: DUF2167 domain-containing protein [Verrucomicrobiota bacterium]
MSILRTLTLAGLLMGLVVPFLNAQETKPAAAAEPTAEEQAAREKEFLKEIEALGWTREGKAKVGSMAEVAIPKGWRFTDGNGTRSLLKMYGNLPGDSELGMLTTEGHGPWVIFEFDDSGYVKDDEKNELDADAMLKSLKEGQEIGNERRREMGLEELQLLGWAVPPRFNDKTKNLEWALRIGSKNGQSINYSTRLLGRNGVMEVDLVCGPEEMDTLVPQYQSIIAGFQYVTGNSYAEYREGDKVAKYGLTALVAGGAAVTAGKMGLFAKLGGIFAKMGKAVIVVIAGIGIALKSLIGKLFGKKEQI